MNQPHGRTLALALLGSGLLVFLIGFRWSGPSNTTNALDQLSRALRTGHQTCPSCPTTLAAVNAAAAPPHKAECNMITEYPTWNQFFDFVEEKTPCKAMKMFGGQHNDSKADGSKAVCMDSKYAPREKECVVLSFGISNEWSFDDAMEKQGCRVYSFDPTMGVKDHKRGQNILFFNLGLSNSEKTIKYGNKDFPVTSLRAILVRNALLGNVIDYLKIDIEGSELDFFNNVLYEDSQLLTHIKQIGMEIHISEQNRERIWKYIHSLRCLGFRQVSSEANTVGGNPYSYGSRRVSHCYELVWINEAYL